MKKKTSQPKQESQQADKANFIKTTAVALAKLSSPQIDSWEKRIDNCEWICACNEQSCPRKEAIKTFIRYLIAKEMEKFYKDLERVDDLRIEAERKLAELSPENISN